MMKLKTRIKNKIMSNITAAEVNKLRKDDAHIDQDYNNIVQILNNG